jgi:hypothetical protein
MSADSAAGVATLGGSLGVGFADREAEWFKAPQELSKTQQPNQLIHRVKQESLSAFILAGTN